MDLTERNIIIILSCRTSIFQPVSEVLLTGVAPLRPVSYRIYLLLFIIYLSTDSEFHTIAIDSNAI